MSRFLLDTARQIHMTPAPNQSDMHSMAIEVDYHRSFSILLKLASYKEVHALDATKRAPVATRSGPPMRTASHFLNVFFQLIITGALPSTL